MLLAAAFSNTADLSNVSSHEHKAGSLTFSLTPIADIQTALGPTAREQKRP
jgi:hypothetical protein